MTRKKKKIILAIVAGSILYVVLGTLFLALYIIPHFRQLRQDNWDIKELEELSEEQILQINPEESHIKLTRCVYKGYDKDIVKANASAEHKEYPFEQVEVHLQAQKNDYILYFTKDTDGILRLTSYETSRSTRIFR